MEKRTVVLLLAALLLPALLCAGCSREAKPDAEEIQSAVTGSAGGNVVVDSYSTTFVVSYDQLDFYASDPGETISVSLTGEVKAMLDFSRITVEVDEAEKTVRVSMPPVDILNTELIESETEISSSLGAPNPRVDSSLMSSFRSKAESEIRNRAVSQGLRDSAKRKAESRVRDLLAGFDLGSYTLSFGWQ